MENAASIVTWDPAHPEFTVKKNLAHVKGFYVAQVP